MLSLGLFQSFYSQIHNTYATLMDSRKSLTLQNIINLLSLSSIEDKRDKARV